MNTALSGERPEKTVGEIAVEHVPEHGSPPLNVRIAHLLRDAADLIEAQGEDGYRRAVLPALDTRSAAPTAPSIGSTAPSETLVLEIDVAYRVAATENALAQVPPERSAEPIVECVPVMHCHLDGWNFTAMYSHARRAVEAGKTRDWVSVRFHRDGLPERRCTVVGDTRGALPGRRVVPDPER